MKLILASASPRRKELLAQLGYAFEVHVANVDESRDPNETPQQYVARIAALKCITVLKQLPDCAVLAADTTVELDGEVLNKPRDRADAERMIRALSGRAHLVHTGVHLAVGAVMQNKVVTTAVTFHDVNDAELAHYLTTDEAMDKAGAYGIQGYAARWIPRIDGDFYNVVGLPLAETARMLRLVAVDLE